MCGVTYDCTSIPVQDTEAEVLLAINILEIQFLVSLVRVVVITPLPTFTKRQKLGDLEIEYAQFNNSIGSSCDDCDNPPIFQSFHMA